MPPHIISSRFRPRSVKSDAGAWPTFFWSLARPRSLFKCWVGVERIVGRWTSNLEHVVSPILVSAFTLRARCLKRLDRIPGLFKHLEPDKVHRICSATHRKIDGFHGRGLKTGRQLGSCFWRPIALWNYPSTIHPCTWPWPSYGLTRSDGDSTEQV